MPIVQSGILPSDKMLFRIGYDGSEPRDLRNRPITPEQTRLAIVINEHYPEVFGAWYLNRRLFGIVQRALEDIGLFVVQKELYAPQLSYPVEAANSLMHDEPYVLITERNDSKGSMLVWQYQSGGGGPFYGDDTVIDCIMPSDVIHKFEEVLKERCLLEKVSFVKLENVNS